MRCCELTFPIAKLKKGSLGGGFKDVLFSTLSGEMIQFDEYFGLKPPTSSEEHREYHRRFLRI